MPTAIHPLGVGDDLLQLPARKQLLMGVGLLLDHKFDLDAVAMMKEEHTLRRQPVAPGAARFLIVAFEVARQIVVNDGTHIGLVDAHAKGDRRHQYRHIVANEALLILTALLVGQTCVIGESANAVVLQQAGEFVDVAPRLTVDDHGLLGSGAQQIEQFTVRAPMLAPHLVRKVGPVEAGYMNVRLPQPELLQDVDAHTLGRGGGQRQHWRLRVALAQGAKLAVLGPEVVAPLADAVGLVNGQQREADMLRHLIEKGEKVAAQQTLGGDVEQSDPPREHSLFALGTLVGAECAIEKGGGDAVGAQPIDLVLHQRDQRRDHHREARQQQRRQLIGERLPAAGRHQYKGVAAGQHMLDDLALARTELLMAEIVF